jgi:hypothetical protein
MSQKALQVVRLLEDFKRAHLPESERNKLDDPVHGASDDHRAPKRPWEDMGQDGAPNGDQAGDVSHLHSSGCIVLFRLTDFLVRLWR